MIKDIIIGTLICVIIFLCSFYIQLLGFFIVIFLPMPVLFFRLKLGRNVGLVIMFISLLIINIISREAPVDMLFCSSMLTVGFFLGEFIENNFSIEKIIASTCFVSFIISCLLLLFHSVLNGQSAFNMISEYISKNLDITYRLYSEMNIIPKEKADLLLNSLDIIKYLLTRILPGLFVITLIFIAWLNILIIKMVLLKKGIVISSLENLKLWKAPEYIVWVVICFSIFLLLPYKNIKFIGFNFIMILMTAYFFQGIAILSFFLERKKFSFIIKSSLYFFLYTLILIQQLFILIIIALGFFDTWINFRKLGTTVSETKE